MAVHAVHDVRRAEPAPEAEDEHEPEPASPASSDSVPRWLRRAIALFFGGVVALVAAFWLLTKLRTLIGMVLVALFLSLAMEPAVDRLARRGWRRGTATLLVLTVVVVLSLGFLAAFGSVVVGQTSELFDHAPRYVRELERFVNDDLGIDWNASGLVRDLRHGRAPIHASSGDIAQGAIDATLTALGFLLQLATVLVFAFYMTADGPRMRRAICSRLPAHRQEMVLDTWEIAIDKTGGYLYSRGIQALVSAMATWLFLFALGVPYSLALGIWVGVVSQFIPTIGTYIAMVLPVLVALVYDPVDALWVLLFLIAYQQFENYLLGPRITKHTMDVHPALAIGTVFAGGLLFGGIGALLALPATAIIQALISAHTVEREVIDAPLTEETDADHPKRLRQLLRWLRREKESSAV
ncbi:MAG TPA: AI-2E family transporter [Acidimicrobiia bacterium]